MKKKSLHRCQYCSGAGVDRYGEPCPCRMMGRMDQYYSRSRKKQDDEEVEIDEREE